MAQTGAGNFNQDLACSRPGERDFLNAKRLTFRVGSRRTHFI
jgi:hypothetical protein